MRNALKNLQSQHERRKHARENTNMKIYNIWGLINEVLTLLTLNFNLTDNLSSVCSGWILNPSGFYFYSSFHSKQTEKGISLSSWRLTAALPSALTALLLYR